MDVQRAQEIAASPIMANVMHEGNGIYIEQVDEQNQTATIHYLNEPNHKKQVSITELLEQ